MCSVNSKTSPASKNSVPIHHKAPDPERPDRSLISFSRHGVLSGNSMTKRCVLNAFIRHFHIFHIRHLICPPKFSISIVFNFSWDGCNTQEKWKTEVMQNLGANKVHYGKCGSGVWTLGIRIINIPWKNMDLPTLTVHKLRLSGVWNYHWDERMSSCLELTWLTKCSDLYQIIQSSLMI